MEVAVGNGLNNNIITALSLAANWATSQNIRRQLLDEDSSDDVDDDDDDEDDEYYETNVELALLKLQKTQRAIDILTRRAIDAPGKGRTWYGIYRANPSIGAADFRTIFDTLGGPPAACIAAIGLTAPEFNHILTFLDPAIRAAGGFSTSSPSLSI